MDQVIANELVQWLSVSREFIAEQAPAVADEIIRWGIISNFSRAVVQAIAVGMILRLRVMQKLNTMRLEDLKLSYGDGIGAGLGMGLTAMVLLGLSLGTFSCIGKCVKAIFMPRLYLIETISKLVGGAN